MWRHRHLWDAGDSGTNNICAMLQPTQCVGCDRLLQFRTGTDAKLTAAVMHKPARPCLNCCVNVTCCHPQAAIRAHERGVEPAPAIHKHQRSATPPPEPLRPGLRRGRSAVAPGGDEVNEEANIGVDSDGPAANGHGIPQRQHQHVGDDHYDADDDYQEQLGMTEYNAQQQQHHQQQHTYPYAAQAHLSGLGHHEQQQTSARDAGHWYAHRHVATDGPGDSRGITPGFDETAGSRGTTPDQDELAAMLAARGGATAGGGVDKRMAPGLYGHHHSSSTQSINRLAEDQQQQQNTEQLAGGHIGAGAAAVVVLDDDAEQHADPAKAATAVADAAMYTVEEPMDGLHGAD